MSTKKTMEYAGYTGSINFCLEDKLLYGKIECINDTVMYEGQSVEGILHAFKEAVDDYLETCKELNRDPNKAFSGTFNTRVGPELHKKLYLEKVKGNYSSINEVLVHTLNQHFMDTPKPTTNHHYHFHDESSTSKETTVENWSESISEGYQFTPTYKKRVHDA